MDMRTLIIDTAYLVSAVLFILGLKWMSSPKTARAGNLWSSLGMLIAIVATLFEKEILSYQLIIIGVLIGSAAGAILATKVKMTAMPQMVGLLNGFGGLASFLVAYSQFYLGNPNEIPMVTFIPILLSVLIGGVTFTGSIAAYAKLEELINTRPITFPFQNFFNLLIGIGAVGICVYLGFNPDTNTLIITLGILALILGWLVVIPIGGADMPVVISLMNSYSGIAGMTTGFVLNNYVLIVAGTLVGASGIILTSIMCKAMNRSLNNVMFGAFGKIHASSGGKEGAGDKAVVTGYGPDDAQVVLDNAQNVIIVPGYGLAVAQAQHAVRELMDTLEKKGINVKFAIHPVAGRMPGHMNVLLAEANVSYDKLVEMDTINPEFETCDVALVVGANDVTNPAAKNDKGSPIYGMPVLEVEKAKTIIFLKRSMNPGFAGIQNELFYNPKTMMLFGDAKDTVVKLVNVMKN